MGDRQCFHSSIPARSDSLDLTVEASFASWR